MMRCITRVNVLKKNRSYEFYYYLKKIQLIILCLARINHREYDGENIGATGIIYLKKSF